MDSVLAPFERLRELVAAVAPESVDNLNGPASQEELRLLRERVPLLPDFWLEFLGEHNGEEMISWHSVFPDGMQLMAVDYILESVAYRDKRTPRASDHFVPGVGPDRAL